MLKGIGGTTRLKEERLRSLSRLIDVWGGYNRLYVESAAKRSLIFRWAGHVGMSGLLRIKTQLALDKKRNLKLSTPRNEVRSNKRKCNKSCSCWLASNAYREAYTWLERWQKLLFLYQHIRYTVPDSVEEFWCNVLFIFRLFGFPLHSSAYESIPSDQMS